MHVLLDPDEIEAALLMPTDEEIAEIHLRTAIEKQRSLQWHREHAKPPTRRYIEPDKPKTRANDPIPDDTRGLPMSLLNPKPKADSEPAPPLATRAFCPECGKLVTSKNGRCYDCHPAGRGGRPRKGTPTDSAERKRERDRIRGLRKTAEQRAVRENARLAEAERGSVPITTATAGNLARQIAAVNAIAQALEGLSPEAVSWVLAPFTGGGPR